MTDGNIDFLKVDREKLGNFYNEMQIHNNLVSLKKNFIKEKQHSPIFNKICEYL